MQEQVEPRLRVVDAGSSAPDGTPGPLRLLTLLEELAGSREYWPEATQRALAARLGSTDRTIRQWMDVLEAAGVAVWRVGGGGRPSTCYLFQSGAAAVEAVEAVLAGRPVWGSSGSSSGSSHSSGQHNGGAMSDSDEGTKAPGTLPVALPVDRPYTESSLSLSSSSALPEEPEATGRGSESLRLFPGPDCGLTLPGRLAKMGIDPTEQLLTALMIVPPDIREAALLRAFERAPVAPGYVLKCIRTVQLFAVAGNAQVAPPPSPGSPAAPPEPERSSTEEPPVPQPEPSAPPALSPAWLQASPEDLRSPWHRRQRPLWPEGGAR